MKAEADSGSVSAACVSLNCLIGEQHQWSLRPYDWVGLQNALTRRFALAPVPVSVDGRTINQGLPEVVSPPMRLPSLSLRETLNQETSKLGLANYTRLADLTILSPGPDQIGLLPACLRLAGSLRLPADNVDHGGRSDVLLSCLEGEPEPTLARTSGLGTAAWSGHRTEHDICLGYLQTRSAGGTADGLSGTGTAFDLVIVFIGLALLAFDAVQSVNYEIYSIPNRADCLLPFLSSSLKVRNGALSSVATTHRWIGARLFASLNCIPEGPSLLIPMVDGLLLEPVLIPGGIPGSLVVVADSSFKLDLGQLQVIQDEMLEAHLVEARTVCRRLSEQVIERLRSPRQSVLLLGKIREIWWNLDHPDIKMAKLRSESTGPHSRPRLTRQGTP